MYIYLYTWIQLTTHARENCKSVMEKVWDPTTAAAMMTRQDAEPVVMMSLADYHAMEENVHPPKALKMLRGSCFYRRSEKGKQRRRSIIEDRD